jgi:hypothetical protein
MERHGGHPKTGNKSKEGLSVTAIHQLVDEDKKKGKDD